MTDESMNVHDPAGTDTSAGIGRKRQRSLSMSSASSSSPKRSASEDPSQESGMVTTIISTQNSSMTSVESEDFDSYMADQGEADIPSTISLGPPLSSQQSVITATEKLAIINKLCAIPMEVGQTWYLVSRQWYRRWEKACSGEVDKEGAVSEGELGPVNNSPLLDNQGSLVSSCIEGVDVQFVCKEAWDHFVAWYGHPVHPLPRPVIARGHVQEPTLELHPPRLRALVLVSSHSLTVAGPASHYMTVSSHDTTGKLNRLIYNELRSEKLASFRIWRIGEEDLGDGSQYPSGRLLALGGEILEPSSTRTLEDALIHSGDAFVLECKDVEDHWLVDKARVPNFGSLPNPFPSLSAFASPPLFGSGSDFFSRLLPSSSVNIVTSTIVNANGSSSSIASSSKLTMVKRSKPGQEPGTLGLGNMGNTCFMNSALQCLAHTEELADYFLTGVYKQELNPDNPLGMQGAIAEAFGALLHRIWAEDSASPSYSPREFKQHLQRFAPQFSGYQQHDSQELVAFLLDGLHEDLNRVLKKPYVEKPDWEGGAQRELIDLANQSWEGYMKRNDSVIVDLFQGQYKSTLVCPECQKVSITFDPFMYLTLPLPVQKKWRHTVLYIPWDFDKPHVKVPIEIGRDSSFKDLRRLLGRWMDTEPDNLLTLEIFNHRFYRSLDDALLCGEMADNDIIVCFELPCNAQQRRTYKRQPGDPFILPVFLCDTLTSAYRNNYRPTGANLFGYPFIAVIDQEQATDVSSMYDAIVERLRRWTVHEPHLFDWQAGSHSPMEEVPIPLNGGAVKDSFTEIQENGDIVTVEESLPEEGDIVDEKSFIVEDLTQADGVVEEPQLPKRLRTKKELFTLRLQGNHAQYGTSGGGFSAGSQRYESWESRAGPSDKDEAESRQVLLKDGDALFCEFDPNMKSYYFGEERSQWENARWDSWTGFVHPEYTEATKSASERQNKGISLEDCLTEFTKEEKLGEDDLWYCPRCKKHQQATKKFDIWKMPDILVVHLKRFSNSRALRDKIDVFVDFPVDGLDLESMAGERLVAKQLVAQGVDIEDLTLGDLEDPLVYDLFAVDEHLGGLGGGHYRAYAKNHLSKTWYHFDDSYVTPAKPIDAVNANAYLLFYRRRTDRHLGQRTYTKIEAARLNPVKVDVQLPTPPDEASSSNKGRYGAVNDVLMRLSRSLTHEFPLTFGNEDWPTPRSNAKSSPASSPPPLDENDPPSFEDSQFDDMVQTTLDPLMIASQQFDFPDPSSRASPTSSNEAEPDVDEEDDSAGHTEWFPHRGPSFSPAFPWASGHRHASPQSDTNPFDDANEQKTGDMDDAVHVQEIPVDESTLLDIE